MILETKNLKKTFQVGKEIVESVKDVSIAIKQGEIFGFIGPNGAGKTTTMRMLSTLLSPSGGTACIAGFDSVKKAQEVRKLIGYVRQNGGLDQFFNAKDNLIYQGQFHGISKKEAEKRASELISLFALESFADRSITTYSGGQRRRLDVALALMHKPKLLFLDEPTTGLDPQSRAQLWQEIQSLKESGMTVFLTTHYLEEIDALCDRVAIIDHGVIVAEGTTNDLKKTISGDLIVIGIDNSTQGKLHNLIKTESYVREINESKDGLRIYVEQGEVALPQLVRLLDKAHLRINNISLSKPSLDDVFLKQTGRSLRENQNNHTTM